MRSCIVKPCLRSHSIVSYRAAFWPYSWRVLWCFCVSKWPYWSRKIYIITWMGFSVFAWYLTEVSEYFTAVICQGKYWNKPDLRCHWCICFIAISSWCCIWVSSWTGVVSLLRPMFWLLNYMSNYEVNYHKYASPYILPVYIIARSCTRVQYYDKVY